MRFTERQRDAIETRDHNILVAAAAGSGKTAVLVERIKSLIIDDRIPPESLLVVTFTKASASEMKDKILKSLDQEIEKNPKNIKFLKDQMDSLNRAQISTFHSFAMSIVRNYFHVIDISPDIKICDEIESTIMKNDAMDEVFMEFFHEENQNFRDFLYKYSTAKGEDALKAQLLKLDEQIQSMPDSLKWFEKQVEELNKNVEAFEKGPVMKEIMNSIQNTILKAAELYDDAGYTLEVNGLKILGEKNRKDVEAIKSMSARSDFYDIGMEIEKFKVNTMRATKEEREGYETVKEQVMALRNKGKKLLKGVYDGYFSVSLEEHVENMRQTYPSGLMLLEILSSFRKTYSVKKKEKNKIDFNDVEHFAIEILKDPRVNEECREKFRYIFIDEYQDSNYLQETIIGSICRENNVFMVGDVKQSIYRFRLAEPDIFRNKYESYKNGKAMCKKIDLNENFRSKSTIIEGINKIFFRLMENYDNDAALNPGIASSDDVLYKTEVHVVDGAPERDEITDELSEWKSIELEALASVQVIKDALGEPIYDLKTETVRPLEKKDIVVLFRGAKNTADIFYKVLSANGIASYMDDNSGYFDTMEILTFINLLKVIDNKRQDVPLLSVLRSPIFSFSIEELINIRLSNKDGSYYHALAVYGDTAGKDEDKFNSNDELKDKINKTMEIIECWKKRASYTPLEEFVWQIMNESGWYAYVGTLVGGKQRQGNLRVFVDKTMEFVKGNNVGIYALLRYIQVIGNRKIETGQVSLMSENDDLVRIMTIHKSKGLEFPMVLICGLGKRFVKERGEKTGSIHKNLGFGMTKVNLKDRSYKRTINQKAIVDRNKAEAMKEEIRILYVAMTRAKDKLVLMGSVDKYKDKKEKMEFGFLTDSSYLDMLLPVANKTGIGVRIHNRDTLSTFVTGEEQNNRDVMADIDKYMGNRNIDLKEKIHRILSYEYPGNRDLLVKSKFTVSEINGKTKETLALRTPLFAMEVSEKKQFTAAEKGTLIHLVMENLDFKDTLKVLDSNGEFEARKKIRSCVNDMEARGQFTREEVSAINIESILHFFQTDLGKRAAKATKIKKEQIFNMMIEHNGSKVMVQGMIDCYFEENNEIVLIDYKNSASDFMIEEKYKEQIRLYSEAIEKGEGKKPKEAYLYLLAQKKYVSISLV